MSAVFGAFAKYAASYVVYAIVAVLGFVCGKKVHKMRTEKKNEENKNKGNKKKK